MHKSGRHNQVANALCKKEVASYVGSLSLVVADFTERVRREAPQDLTDQKLGKQVKEGTIRRYLLENKLMYLT